VSWFIAYAIDEYLDDIVGEFLNAGNKSDISDNYSICQHSFRLRNYKLRRKLCQDIQKDLKKKW
jgi:hypothetical protein